MELPDKLIDLGTQGLEKEVREEKSTSSAWLMYYDGHATETPFLDEIRGCTESERVLLDEV